MGIDKRRRFACLALISVITPLMLSNLETDETSSTTIYVDPPTIQAPFLEDFKVDINIEDVTNLNSWQARLKWDPQLLDIVNFTEGDFLKAGGSTVGGTWVSENEGWIFVHSYLKSDDSVILGVSGSGTLANVEFYGASLGECVLYLYDTMLFDSEPVSVPTPPYWGDADGNLEVNILDLGNIAMAWGTSVGHPRYDPDADFDNDGFVDLFDLLCGVFNFGRYYPENVARKPVEIVHEANDGQVTVSRLRPVTWKWLDDYDNRVWLTASVDFSGCYPIGNFAFNRSLGQIGFNFTSATSGFCNVSVPKLVMDGGFKVLLNDTQVASILSWNKTHTFVYFSHGQGRYNVTIIGEIVTGIRSPDLLYIVDITGDGIVNMMDLTPVAARFQWKEDS